MKLEALVYCCDDKVYKGKHCKHCNEQVEVYDGRPAACGSYHVGNKDRNQEDHEKLFCRTMLDAFRKTRDSFSWRQTHLKASKA
jgi:hypothetical protein